MSSDIAEKVRRWSIKEHKSTENGKTKYNKEESFETEESDSTGAVTRRNSQVKKESSSHDTSSSPAKGKEVLSSTSGGKNVSVTSVNDSRSDETEDIYLLSDISDSDVFQCTLGSKCLLGDCRKRGTKKMEYKTRQWHDKCFACCVCQTQIGSNSFIPREQEIYCVGCYENKFATRCTKCDKAITKGGVTYKDQPWHRECFTCTNCDCSLPGQRFTSRDDKPYCSECFGELFAKRCTSCSRPITGIGGARFISFEDNHWHNDCFVCSMCNISLAGKGFIKDNDDILCPDCAKERLM